MSGEIGAVVGGGGREFELARMMVEDGYETVYALGGNPGMGRIPGVEVMDVRGNDGVASFVDERDVGFTIIGSENDLVPGMADAIRAKDRLVLGHGELASVAEASKLQNALWCDEFKVPQPLWRSFDDYEKAKRFFSDPGVDVTDWVIKAVGLAGGKGVTLPQTQDEALQELHALMVGGKFKKAGEQVVVQEYLEGPEVSLTVISDGKGGIHLFPTSQDHKRAYDGDEGPNTGGQGAFAPVPETIMSADQWSKAENMAYDYDAGMRRIGRGSAGVWYMALILATKYGGDPRMIEANVRFGDPEAEVIIPVEQARLGGGATHVLRSAAEGRLWVPPTSSRAGTVALSVCLAGEGYPTTKYENAPRPVYGLDGQYEDAVVQTAAVTRDAQTEQYVSPGGRIVYATGFGPDYDVAADKAYQVFDNVKTRGGFGRTDIGHQVRSQESLERTKGTWAA